MSPVSPLVTSFREMASMLGWRRNMEVWMLWGFFDESGHHPEQGNLDCLTIGGWIATTDDWVAFSLYWGGFLTKWDIRCFHMTDFEKSKGEFQGWSQAKHKIVLNEALELIARHLKYCFGVSVHIPEPNRPKKGTTRWGKRTLGKFYQECMEDIIYHSGRHAAALNDRIALRFASHPEFSFDRVFEAFGEFRIVDPRFFSVSAASPTDFCPLQAADIVAYEANHFHQNLDTSLADSQLRYPLRTLVEKGVGFGALEWRMSPPTMSRRFFLRNPPPD